MCVLPLFIFPRPLFLSFNSHSLLCFFSRSSPLSFIHSFSHFISLCRHKYPHDHYFSHCHCHCPPSPQAIASSAYLTSLLISFLLSPLPSFSLSLPLPHCTHSPPAARGISHFHVANNVPARFSWWPPATPLSLCVLPRQDAIPFLPSSPREDQGDVTKMDRLQFTGK